MRLAKLALVLLTACLLPGCSAQLLEEANDPGIPRYCGEPAKLFTIFVVQAKNISWASRRSANGTASSVTIDLVFENTAKWPLALSNSGNGIIYSIDYALLGENGTTYFPEETAGVTHDMSAEKKVETREKPGERKKEKPINVHQLIKSAESAEGKLIFEVPRGNYVLSIERKFEGKPVPGNREDHLLMCKISSSDFSAPLRSKSRGVFGVY